MNQPQKLHFLAFLGLTALLGLGGACQNVCASSSIPFIRVRMVLAAKEITFRGMDLELQGQTIPGKSEWTAKCQTTGRILFYRQDAATVPALGANVPSSLLGPDGQAALEAQLSIGKKNSSAQIFVGPVRVQSPAGMVTANGKVFREEVWLFPKDTSGCDLVNRLNIESYLVGLINGEISSKWPFASIQAQAIAARSYAMAQIKSAEAEGKFFDLDSTIKDQVYLGFEKEDPTAKRGVTSTSGIVLTAEHAGRIFPLRAYFHSTCGGVTELPENVWHRSERGFKRRVICSTCRQSSVYTWRETFTLGEVERALNRWFGGGFVPAGFTRQLLLELKGRTLGKLSPGFFREGGRLENLLLTWIHPRKPDFNMPIRAPDLRLLLGTQRIKSTFFRLFPGLEQKVVLEGNGMGHGVGLCQFGAKGMAEAGKGYAQILNHYYPDAKQVKQW